MKLGSNLLIKSILTTELDFKTDAKESLDLQSVSESSFNTKK